MASHGNEEEGDDLLSDESDSSGDPSFHPRNISSLTKHLSDSVFEAKLREKNKKKPVPRESDESGGISIGSEDTSSEELYHEPMDIEKVKQEYLNKTATAEQFRKRNIVPNRPSRNNDENLAQSSISLSTGDSTNISGHSPMDIERVKEEILNRTYRAEDYRKQGGVVPKRPTQERDDSINRSKKSAGSDHSSIPGASTSKAANSSHLRRSTAAGSQPSVVTTNKNISAFSIGNKSRSSADSSGLSISKKDSRREESSDSSLKEIPSGEFKVPRNKIYSPMSLKSATSSSSNQNKSMLHSTPIAARSGRVIPNNFSDMTPISNPVVLIDRLEYLTAPRRQVEADSQKKVPQFDTFVKPNSFAPQKATGAPKRQNSSTGVDAKGLHRIATPRPLSKAVGAMPPPKTVYESFEELSTAAEDRQVSLRKTLSSSTTKQSTNDTPSVSDTSGSSRLWDFKRNATRVSGGASLRNNAEGEQPSRKNISPTASPIISNEASKTKSGRSVSSLESSDKYSKSKTFTTSRKKAHDATTSEMESGSVTATSDTSKKSVTVGRRIGTTGDGTFQLSKSSTFESTTAENTSVGINNSGNKASTMELHTVDEEEFVEKGEAQEEESEEAQETVEEDEDENEVEKKEEEEEERDIVEEESSEEDESLPEVQQKEETLANATDPTNKSSTYQEWTSSEEENKGESSNEETSSKETDAVPVAAKSLDASSASASQRKLKSAKTRNQHRASISRISQPPNISSSSEEREVPNLNPETSKSRKTLPKTETTGANRKSALMTTKISDGNRLSQSTTRGRSSVALTNESPGSSKLKGNQRKSSARPSLYVNPLEIGKFANETPEPVKEPKGPKRPSSLRSARLDIVKGYVSEQNSILNRKSSPNVQVEVSQRFEPPPIRKSLKASETSEPADPKRRLGPKSASGRSSIAEESPERTSMEKSRRSQNKSEVSKRDDPPNVRKSVKDDVADPSDEPKILAGPKRSSSRHSNQSNIAQERNSVKQGKLSPNKSNVSQHMDHPARKSIKALADPIEEPKTRPGTKMNLIERVKSKGSPKKSAIPQIVDSSEVRKSVKAAASSIKEPKTGPQSQSNSEEESDEQNSLRYGMSRRKKTAATIKDTSSDDEEAFKAPTKPPRASQRASKSQRLEGSVSLKRSSQSANLSPLPREEPLSDNSLTVGRSRPPGKYAKTKGTKLQPKAIQKLNEHILKATESPEEPSQSNVVSSRTRIRRRRGAGSTYSGSSLHPSEIYGGFVSNMTSRDVTTASSASRMGSPLSQRNSQKLNALLSDAEGSQPKVSSHHRLVISPISEIEMEVEDHEQQPSTSAAAKAALDKRNISEVGSGQDKEQEGEGGATFNERNIPGSVDLVSEEDGGTSNAGNVSGNENLASEDEEEEEDDEEAAAVPALSHAELMALFAEKVQETDIPGKLVRGENDLKMCAKEDLRRYFLIAKGHFMTEEELNYIHDKTKKFCVDFTNKLTENASLPAGVFTYQDLRKALLAEDLINDNNYEPHMQIHEFFTTEMMDKVRGVLIPSKGATQWDTFLHWQDKENKQ